MLGEEEIYDWLLCQPIGFDHEKNKVYKVIDKYKDYWALKIIPFSFHSKNFDQSLLFCDQHEDALIYRNTSFTFHKKTQQLFILSTLPSKTLSQCLQSTDYSQRIEYFRNISNTISYLHLAKKYIVKILNSSSIFIKDNKAYLNNYSFCNEETYSKIMKKAPQVLNGQNFTYKSDIWCLGHILIAILQGKQRNCFQNNEFQIQKSENWTNLIENMTNQKPENRPTIEEVLEQFNKIEPRTKIEEGDKLVQKKEVKREENMWEECYRQIKNKDQTKILNLNNMDILTILPFDEYISLQWLYLSNNLIEKIENINKIPFLKGVDLSYNKIRKIQNLEGMKNLQQLYLNNNEIKRIQNLNQLPALKVLYLQHNRIQLAKGLNGLPSLEKVILKYNPLFQYDRYSSFALIV